MSEKLKQFALVEFTEFTTDKKSVELVPTSWLTENEEFCMWPPKTREHYVQEWIKKELLPEKDWSAFPVKVISKAKDYNQGMRRLERSYKKSDVETSEAESQSAGSNISDIMTTSAVHRELAKTKPMMLRKQDSEMRTSNEELFDDELFDDDDGNSAGAINSKRTIEEPSQQSDDINVTLTSFNDVAIYLKGVIEKEMEKTRRSLSRTMTERFAFYVKAVNVSANANCDQAWKTIGDGLPFGILEDFLKFEDSLQESEKTRSALVEIVQMMTAGLNKVEDDVAAIIGKIIKKDVQLQYSGCGKKVKGIGKKSFKDTQTFDVIDKFLRAKYVNATEKVSTVTAVSRFLAGARDRNGGRADRAKNKEL